MASVLPPEAEGLGLSLLIGLLLGVERGWRMREEQAGARVAGIRTFALLGLLGGLAGIAAAGTAFPIALLLVAGAIGALLLGYVLDAKRDSNVSATTTLAGILTLALGGLATTGNMALSAVGAGAAVILLASRAGLHRTIELTSEKDLHALLRLVLVVFVVLPLLPDRAMGPYGALNPFRLWTVVVITGAVSFVGYVLARLLGEKRGALVTAAVGSLVSSTAVTVDAARPIRAGVGKRSAHAAVAIASSIMLIRSLILVAAIAPYAFQRFAMLTIPGLIASAIATALLLRGGQTNSSDLSSDQLRPPGLGIAFLFAATVALLSVAAAWAQAQWGGESGAILVAIGGIADIDAAIATIGTMPRGLLAVEVAALALAAPTFFNTVFKLGLLAAFAGPRRAKAGMAALSAVSVALLVPIAVSLFVR